jgi:YVTN family beta-propeller protein
MLETRFRITTPRRFLPFAVIPAVATSVTTSVTTAVTTLATAVTAVAFAASTAWAAAPTAYVTSEKAGVGVIDLDQMSLTKTFPVGADGPRGLSLNKDGSRLLVANKNTGDMAVIDTASGQVAQRVKIGKNPEYVRVHNGYAYVTYEPGEEGGQCGQWQTGCRRRCQQAACGNRDCRYEDVARDSFGDERP